MFVEVFNPLQAMTSGAAAGSAGGAAGAASASELVDLTALAIDVPGGGIGV